MSDPQKYEYDVFISYRRVDRVKTWMRDYFVKKLTEALELELDDPPKIFWDEPGVEEGNRFTPIILKALKTSKCLVTIWVKPYFQSPWCVAEWRTFVERAKNENRDADGLTIPVRLHDSEKFAMEFKAFDFREFNHTAPYWVQTDKFLNFEKQVDNLAKRISDLVKSVPDFNINWEVVEPEAIQLDDEAFEGWAFHLKEQ